jgi:hypothetical protein
MTLNDDGIKTAHQNHDGPDEFHLSASIVGSGELPWQYVPNRGLRGLSLSVYQQWE